MTHLGSFAQRLRTRATTIESSRPLALGRGETEWINVCQQGRGHETLTDEPTERPARLPNAIIKWPPATAPLRAMKVANRRQCCQLDGARGGADQRGSERVSDGRAGQGKSATFRADLRLVVCRIAKPFGANSRDDKQNEMESWNTEWALGRKSDRDRPRPNEPASQRESEEMISALQQRGRRQRPNFGDVDVEKLTIFLLPLGHRTARARPA